LFCLYIYNMIKKIILFLYLSFISLLSIMPPSDIPKIQVFPHFDKLVHMLFYAGLTFLLIWNLSKNKNKNKFWLILSFVFWCGLFMEIIQGVSNLGRTFDLLDVFSNVLGFFICLLILKLIFILRGERNYLIKI
jgi:hypothetical protein